MSEPPQRPRGRAGARARGRPTETGAPPVAQARGPVQAPPSAAATHPTGATGGRRNHRGVPRSEVESITSHMSALEMVGESKGRGAMRHHREDEPRYESTRPQHIENKKGTVGEPITLVANFFELLSKPQWVVHQYHVEFAPNVESPRIRRALIGVHREALGSAYLFDGMSDLKMTKKLENAVSEFHSERKTDSEIIRITVKHVRELAPNDPELGRLYNTQMRRNLQYLKYTLLGRHYFDSDAISEVPEYKLRIWQGVITSIRQQEEALMMCVDTVHKVVRDDTALDIIKNLIDRTHGRNYQDAVVNELVGTIVMTRYNNRTYRVEEIMWDMKPSMTFDAKDGPVSYVNYYQKQYDIRIRDGQQPLMLCTSKEREVRGGQRESKKIYLIPELCCMTGLSDRMRSNFSLMKELSNHTKLDPKTRVRNLHNFIEKINTHPEIRKEMDAWQLRFSPELVQVQARVLPAEVIIQGQAKYRYNPKDTDFSAEMRGKTLHVPTDMREWLVVATERDRGICDDFINTFFRVSKPMGMRAQDPRVLYIDNDRVSNFIQAFRENLTNNTAIVVFIVPNDKKDRYDALKKAACIDFPVPSQVIISKTLANKKRVMSVTTKVAIQMACKMGGEPWALEIPLKMAVMIIGFDTYHDSSRKGMSAGGFVASLNSTFTRWYSRASFHSAGGWEELSNHLKTNLTKAFQTFYNINKRPPSLILFYRDGVGDGQIRYVLEHEVNQLVNTISEVLEAGVAPEEMKTQYSFIVVNKKINTKVFAKFGQSFGNPPPGTVVDSVITRDDRYDFFLVSQSAKQGTVAPTMFNVIKDRSSLKPDHMQRLSYKLTHLYFNFPGTIRVPAPCQYAHKLAFLAGQSLHREPSEKLTENLFYL